MSVPEDVAVCADTDMAEIKRSGGDDISAYGKRDGEYGYCSSLVGNASLPPCILS